MPKPVVVGPHGKAFAARHWLSEAICAMIPPFRPTPRRD